VKTENRDWLIYYWPGERAKEEIRKAKLKGINSINQQDREREYLPEPQEEGKKYSEEQVNLINKLVKLNVSKITAENLVKSKGQKLIKEWMEAINYANADDKAAYLVKAIKENWQLPEEYLGKKREERRKEEEENRRY
jgi:3-methyladenine DNA glycosylase AlkD